ncbi:succinate dehydrogenase, hydrophobic membrane anchor protein [Mesobaculum littorinae]|uniref:Succinate dehydrogenase hydrophobic membrane anchor subunit n=1 Tax=Mesobaculum littorinae TaxID=2486419 RepID=A0A438AD66_9RHOB|nr:succinate dehydrogenase, hydrophobic membrane anchor protein [Mesobaculum littorinae]RVV96640.1 succinate dehydrogenase, hydrophobic membrane anchor protein [Mesobaculum littorinae]
MSFITDRKRATGMGSAKTGTAHHWQMTISSVALVVLVPLFVFTFGPMLGQSHEQVIARFSAPFPALVAALTFLVGFHHFRGGVQVAIEDYVGGLARKALILLMICISYGAAAVAIFAIARIAL